MTVAAKTSEGWGAYVEESGRVQVMEQLGFKQSETIAGMKAEGFSVPISEENLDQLDADLLLTFPIYIEDKEVTEDAAYKRIPAVEDGHDFVLTKDNDDIRKAFSLNSILSAEYTAEELPGLIADKVK